MTVRVPGNDYSVLDVPALGSWTPRLTVSVVVPAYGGQDKLDLVLAALARQTYPQELMEVIVVDNGSDPPLRLGTLRPELTRLIVCSTPGRPSARNAGLRSATGDVVFWLDSDVVLTPRAVEAHMRWHHQAPYLVVTSRLRFTPAEPPTPDVIAATDDLATLFEPAEPHQWLVDLLERTGGLIEDPHRAFSLHVGGATSVGVTLLRRTGPMDTDLTLGQDTELGYRLAQVGAVFVPDAEAVGYHLGPSMRMRDKPPIDRVSHAFIADRVPSYRWLRSHPARDWKVPHVQAVIEAGGYDEVRASVDALLAGTVPDVAVQIIGPWDTLTPERRAPLTDPHLDLVLIHGHYAHDGRVRLLTREEPTFAPYRLRLPAGWVPGEDTVASLLDLVMEEGYGLINVLLAEDGEDILAARLERTAAFARAEIVKGPGESIDDIVEEIFGVLWLDGASRGFLPAADAPPILGRRSAYRARVHATEEAQRLGEENGRLREQVTKWRDEAARWRKSAVEYRREIANLRKELAAAKKALQQQPDTDASLVTSFKRALGRRRP